MALLTKEDKRTQLYFGDGHWFKFRRMPLENSCIVEKENGLFKRAWKHFFGSEIPFRGYKNISADSVTLGFSRDIILDPFGKVPKGKSTSQKPDSDPKSIKDWIAKIAENMRHQYSNKRETRTAGDAIFWVIIGIDIIMLIGWAVRFFIG